MRIAIYCRVSTQEQAEHGLSIDTQLANLREWATKNNHEIVGEYVDAGISGKKPPAKRPQLQRFFDDIAAGLKVDALVFTKLDRFFRSVKLYYQAVDILEKHKVAWIAIHEDYETVTAAGRMKVNIMLAVAENEADRTAERIKVVFDRKIANGECVNPSGLPMGYSYDPKTKHIYPNADAQLVKKAFEHYDRTGSVRDTLYHIQEKIGKPIYYKSLEKVLKNRLYIGEYKGNTEYCKPIIDRDLFFRVQHGLQERSIRYNPTRRVYLFSGLVYCGVCGRKMSGVTLDHIRIGYRCNHAYQSHVCTHRKYYSENIVEQFLLNHVNDHFETTQVETQQEQKPVVDIEKAKEKLNRLKDLYVDGLIDKEQYLADRERISAPLMIEPQPKKRSIEIKKEEFLPRYQNMTREEKRDLWRAILERIEIANGEVRYYFSP